jgi:ATP-dependent protease ClpP protease subunit
MKKRSPFQHRAGRLKVRALADEAEILLYDEIGFWGVTAEEFRRELDALTAATVHVRINSPGGSVFDGLAIYNALREHDAHIITHVDGLAASMASLVALAGDEVRMSENAFYMIHDPWTITIGDAKQLRKDAALLDKIGGTAAEAYRAKTKAAIEQVQEWMSAESWFNGAEALELGFVDALDNINEEEDDDLLAAVAAFDLSVYAHVPDALTMDAAREPTTRELEQALRDVGLSQIAAKAFVSGGREATVQRDAEPSGQREAAEPSVEENVLALVRIRTMQERTHTELLRR